MNCKGNKEKRKKKKTNNKNFPPLRTQTKPRRDMMTENTNTKKRPSRGGGLNGRGLHFGATYQHAALLPPGLTFPARMLLNCGVHYLLFCLLTSFESFFGFVLALHGFRLNRSWITIGANISRHVPMNTHPPPPACPSVC